jgi:hypothetical protein
MLVAEHPRCWARQQSITDPAHRQAADVMRRTFQNRRSAGRGPAAGDVQERDLSAYDRAFGLDDGQVA